MIKVFSRRHFDKNSTTYFKPDYLSFLKLKLKFYEHAAILYGV